MFPIPVYIVPQKQTRVCDIIPWNSLQDANICQYTSTSRFIAVVWNSYLVKHFYICLKKKCKFYMTVST